MTSPDGTDLCSVSRFQLDLSFGESGNNFELSGDLPGAGRGCLVAIEGTEYGGVIDSVELNVSGGRSSLRWLGRTWHGVLFSKLLVPDQGQDYLEVSGEANAVLAQLVERVGLSSVFSVSGEDSGIRVEKRFERPFVTAYGGIVDMLHESSAVLCISRIQGVTSMWAAPATTYGGVDSDLVDFKATRSWRPVNHLHCAGTGELSERLTLDLYADEGGNVSRTQTLFGIDEVAEGYDYSNADMERLEEDGTKKLREYQSQGSVGVYLPAGVELRVGDMVFAADRSSGNAVQAMVSKKIVRASRGDVTVEYECGDSETGSSGGIFGSAEAPTIVPIGDIIGIATLMAET